MDALAQKAIDYDNTVYNMHRYLLPIIGFFTTIGALFFSVILAKYRDKVIRVFPTTLLLLTMLQIFISYFFFLTAQGWQLAIQLTVTGVLGFYVSLIFEKEWLKLYMVVCLFNLFCLIGKLSFMGYSENIYDLFDGAFSVTSGPVGTCYRFYNVNVTSTSSLCSGYISYSRLLGFFLIYAQALQTFLTFFIWREFERVVEQRNNFQLPCNFNLFNPSTTKSTYSPIVDNPSSPKDNSSQKNLSSSYESIVASTGSMSD